VKIIHPASNLKGHIDDLLIVEEDLLVSDVLADTTVLHVLGNDAKVGTSYTGSQKHQNVWMTKFTKYISN